jgi:hypothetical protein
MPEVQAVAKANSVTVIDGRRLSLLRMFVMLDPYSLKRSIAVLSRTLSDASYDASLRGSIASR